MAISDNSNRYLIAYYLTLSLKLPSFFVVIVLHNCSFPFSLFFRINSVDAIDSNLLVSNSFKPSFLKHVKTGHIPRSDIVSDNNHLSYYKDSPDIDPIKFPISSTPNLRIRAVKQSITNKLFDPFISLPIKDRKSDNSFRDLYPLTQSMYEGLKMFQNFNRVQTKITSVQSKPPSSPLLFPRKAESSHQSPACKP